MTGTRYSLEVNPTIPARLKRLEELANDLLYSWDREVRGLYFRLDRQLWEACGHNPKVFLRRISQQRLDEAAEDRIFVEDYNRVLSVYDTYHQERAKSSIQQLLDPEQDLVAYFCAEFGFHESFQIYSGGMGILAGDHCKAASDLGIPFVAVGVLYRQGYFTQTIDAEGNQVAHYAPTHFADLPIRPATDAKGQEIHVPLDMPGRRVTLKVWKAKAGHITLYLLDSDLPENAEADRRITYQLYGGDINTRIQQEIVLGIGGVRALRAVGLKPTVWHINEGHAAFMILERCREHVGQDLDFDGALELVAANTVFTTHTPVPAGHDIFDQHLMQTYFADYARQLGLDMDRFLGLGANTNNPGGFNQTALALRGSRFRNGVSRTHGGVAARMAAYLWPQIPPDENPLGYITNGVHVPTFLAREWVSLFDMRFGGGWRNELLNKEFWEHINDIPDHSYWSLRQSLKAEMLSDVRRRVILQQRRNCCSEALIGRYIQHLTPHETDILTIGFARRFATYKRATLLFSDPQRLARLFSDPRRPVLLIVAGKAHPNDAPAQRMIKVIHDFSRRPEFAGKILVVEGYDLALARKLVTGVDVWLNTPEYPLEASGTSGEKAAINGVINLSVLDGWWDEGFNGENGWSITPHGPQFDHAYRDREEGQELLEIIEKQVIPLYYERNGYGYSEGWVKKSKASMKSVMPRFNAQRMVMDYVQKYYAPARKQLLVMQGNNFARARELAAWRKKIAQKWPQVRLQRLDSPAQQITSGAVLPLRVAAALNGLEADDVLVECLVGTESESGEFVVKDKHVFSPAGRNDAGETLFNLDLKPRLPGLQYYEIRIYPFHAALAHRFEAGYMIRL
ncbi:MAG: alpha-glucan phosphorylase [Candidatus Muproteobacteria bacterium RIFCSPHIGHO2_01_FULL_65_16]|uniref:Alpha-glucan phosphorylase n=1 Tax=Candidatus Muproteobacteria bacterium RIFCSPHIGHO2_01_FULL_65_16 TaxID=1817764 RepID=A0A1F6TPJ7_9PROT|nr:MAG: alpha-glucan phosphorylase [Candidatus Muproteobacteria bacterium RIFCSPHIGHO2_01_FULL_65_16]